MKKTNSIKSVLHSNKFSSNDLSIKPTVVFGIDENDFIPKNAKDVWNHFLTIHSLKQKNKYKENKNRRGRHIVNV